MHTLVLEKISEMYNKMDSVLITNKHGIVEYSAVFNENNGDITNEGYTGYNILEIYPELTETTSTHFRVYKTGQPVINEFQTVKDFNGKELSFISSTYPIKMGDEIIGAIEGTVYITQDGKRYRNISSEGSKSTPKEHKIYTLDDFITVDEKMIEIKNLVERVAEGESFALITGNTGTGKELIAEALHSHSSRKNNPFISQNCAAIPTGLLESLLFGTTKGSYTGAEDRKGLFELANNGTLFLDEINSMDISLQSKILKVIEEQKVRRIGGYDEIAINIRIISAMNQDPISAIRENRLREDLYYRLGVIQINLPPLCERKDDIKLLTNYYINHFNCQTGKNITKCSDIVQNAFHNYTWPGNVRELKNAIEYAFNVTKGNEITLADIPEHILYDNKDDLGESKKDNWISMLEAGISLTNIVDNFEKSLIEDIVNKSSTVAEAANKLNITRQSLNYKLSKYKIDK